MQGEHRLLPGKQTDRHLSNEARTLGLSLPRPLLHDLPVVGQLGVVWVNLSVFGVPKRAKLAGERASCSIARAPLRSKVRLMSPSPDLVCDLRVLAACRRGFSGGDTLRHEDRRS